jgi:hypothetical protein
MARPLLGLVADVRDDAYEILAYLSDNPASEDTLDGIHWWLLRRYVQRSTHELERALAGAVDAGWIQERHGGDGRRLYRLNPTRAGELKTLLSAHSATVC